MKMKLIIEIEPTDNEEAEITLSTVASMFKEGDDEAEERQTRAGFRRDVIHGIEVGDNEEPTELPLEPEEEAGGFVENENVR